jgi:hypothetical protein
VLHQGKIPAGLVAVLPLYAAADAPEAALPAFWERLFERAEQEARRRNRAYLLLDEVQSLPGWAARLKGEWDRIRRLGLPLHMVATGSSALRLGSGSRENLAGRFERLTLGHWPAGSLKKDPRGAPGPSEPARFGAWVADGCSAGGTRASGRSCSGARKARPPQAGPASSRCRGRSSSSPGPDRSVVAEELGDDVSRAVQPFEELALVSCKREHDHEPLATLGDELVELSRNLSARGREIRAEHRHQEPAQAALVFRLRLAQKKSSASAGSLWPTP